MKPLLGLLTLALGLALVFVVVGCQVATYPAPGSLGDAGWRVPVFRWGGETTTEGGPRK